MQGRGGARLAWFCLLGLGGCGAAQPAASGPSASPAGASADAPSATSTTGPEICSNAADDNQNGVIDEGCGQPSGLVQFMAGWSAARADIDLRVVDPNGELIEVGRVAKSGLTKDRDCPGRGAAECHGRNLENVYLTEREPLPGEYRVRLRLEALGGEALPVRVTLGVRLVQQTSGYEVLLDAPEAEREIRLRL